MGHATRRLKVSRRMRASVAVALGVLVMGLGVFILYGLGWALIIVGASTVVLFLAVYDVDEPERPALESTVPRHLAPRSEDFQ